MSSISTSSLSESSDFVECSQAQASTVSSGKHEEIKRKVYMKKKDRKASINQQTSLNGIDNNKESSDSDSSPTNSTKSASYSLKSCESSYGSCNSALSSEASSPVPSDSNSSRKSKSSDNSNLSSDEVEEQLRFKEATKTAGQKMMEEELVSENLFNSNCIAEDIRLYKESKEQRSN